MGKRPNPRTLAREKLLFRYSSALERGDFDAVQAVLREAENDAVLERMILELNDAYRAEWSAHENHHAAREERLNMINAIPVQAPARRVPWTLLAAAALAVVIFGTALFAMNRRGPNEVNLSALAGSATPTAATSATPIPSLTFTPTPFQAVGGAGSPQILCQGVIAASEGVNLFSRPTVNAIVVGRLPFNAVVDVLEMAYPQVGPAATPDWYYVSAAASGQTMQGWIVADSLSAGNPCVTAVIPRENMPTVVPPGYMQPNPTIPPSAFAPTLVPTPIGRFASALGMGFLVVATEDIDGVPAGSRLRLSSGKFVGEWRYAAVTEDGQVIEVRDEQLAWGPEVTPGMTPTSPVDMGGFSGLFITREQVGNIPAGTQVQVTGGYYYGMGEWVYTVVTLDNQIGAEARFSQLEPVNLPATATATPLPMTAVQPSPTATLVR
jgi:hypothetical protein